MRESQNLWRPAYVPPGRDLAAHVREYRREYVSPVIHTDRRIVTEVSRTADPVPRVYEYKRTYVSGSPVRSDSPPVVRVIQKVERVPHAVNVTRYLPAFSHYEQHREQRE